MNLWKKTSLGILIVILILSGMLIFLLNTTGGLYLLFSIANHWMPGLEVEQLSGNLHNLYLKNVTYIQPGLVIKTDEFHLVIRKLYSLREKSLCIKSLSLKNANLEIDLGKFSKLELKEKNTSSVIGFLISYPISLDRMTLNNINININDAAISIAKFTSDFFWKEKCLIMNSTYLKGLLIALPKVKREIEKRNTIRSKIQWLGLEKRSLRKVLKVFLSELAFPKMTNVYLPLNFNIKKFEGECLRLIHPISDTDLIVNNILMDIRNIDRSMYLNILHINSNHGKLNNVTANVKLYDNWPVNISLSGILSDLSRDEKIKLKIRGFLREKIELNISLSGPMTMDLFAKIHGHGSREVFSSKHNSFTLSKKTTQAFASLIVKNFRWRAASAENIYINGYIKSVNQIYGRLNIHAKNIIIHPNLKVNLATLKVIGNKKRHSLQLWIQSKPISGRLYLIGNFDQQERCWKGQLGNIFFKTPIGSLTLIRPSLMNYLNTEKISISSLCQSKQKIEFNMPQTINVNLKRSYVAINLNHFNLEILEPLTLLDNAQISGVFNGQINMIWNFSSRDYPQGKIIFSGRHVKVSQLVNDNAFLTKIDIKNLQINLNNNRTEIIWTIYLANSSSSNGRFDGKVQLSDLQGYYHLNGKINISNINLSVGMANTVPIQGCTIGGIINANLRVLGNVRSPKIFGQMQISNIAIDNSFIPFDIQSSQIMIDFIGMRSIFYGEVHTRQGLIHLNGNINWNQISNWNIHTSMTGNKIRVTIPPMICLDISPNIVFEITPIKFLFNGYIDVSWANIVVHELPENTPKISNDEIILDSNMKPIESKSIENSIYGNLIIHIGNNVKIDAFGIKSNLIGSMKIIKNKQGIYLNGQISMSKGRFRSYGQDFLIRKGEIFFSNASIQPFINIEVIRNPENTENNVTVGMRITGATNELKAEIFSEPIMSQQEILSYLLRGYGMHNQEDNTATITPILIRLWTTQSSQVINKIGAVFGVNNLTLDTQGVGNSSQLVVSGYILPSLQIKYGVGIFNALETLTLHYHLMPKLYLEAVSGIHQTINLFYQFDF